jgi:hypothetical protein
VLKIPSLILQGDCIKKKISVLGKNMSLRVIELLKKRGSYSAVFKAVKQKLLCLEFHLEASCKSNREIATRKKISLGQNICSWY